MAQVNRLGVKWFETRGVSSSRKSPISVRPQGFPWISRILPRDHWPDSLKRLDGTALVGPLTAFPVVEGGVALVLLRF